MPPSEDNKQVRTSADDCVQLARLWIADYTAVDPVHARRISHLVEMVQGIGSLMGRISAVLSRAVADHCADFLLGQFCHSCTSVQSAGMVTMG